MHSLETVGLHHVSSSVGCHSSLEQQVTLLHKRIGVVQHLFPFHRKGNWDTQGWKGYWLLDLVLQTIRRSKGSCSTMEWMVPKDLLRSSLCQTRKTSSKPCSVEATWPQLLGRRYLSELEGFQGSPVCSHCSWETECCAHVAWKTSFTRNMWIDRIRRSGEPGIDTVSWV